MVDMKGITVLAVDDDMRYLRLLRFNLEAAGYRVVTATSGEEALIELAEGKEFSPVSRKRSRGIGFS